MAIQDYYIDIYYVEKVRQSDGTGGFEYVYTIGNTFKGSVVKSSTQEQTVAAIRGEPKEQYMITTYDNNVLEKDDIVMYVNPDGKRVYLRINANPTYTPNQSGQSNWKYVQATLYTPDLRVVN